MSFLCFDTLWNFSASLPRNGNVVVQRRTSSLSVSCRRERYCSSFDIFSRRVASSWTLVFNADHQLDDHREFRDRSVNGRGRVVPSHRIGSYRFIWSRLLNADTPSEQCVALLLIACRRSQSVSNHAGRSLVVVNIRLTARLQSLPLARC